MYLLAWNVHQFFQHPQRLFDANILYPTPGALALTDHRLLPSLAVAPVVWVTGNAVFAYNVAIAAACVLAAVSASRLARVLGLDGRASWAAGALYAFHTYQLNEASRLNIICHGFIPLALAELVLYLRTREGRHAWMLAGYMLLQGLSSNYHLLYGALLLALVLAGALVFRPMAIARSLPGLVAPTAVAALLFVPIALPYVRAARMHGYMRELPVGVDLAHYVSTSPWNLLYGPIGMTVGLREQRGPHFVGFLSLALLGLAIASWAMRRGGDSDAALISSRVWVPAAVALAVLFVLLSLGRDVAVFGREVGMGPYRVLYRFVPGFTLVRIPERLGLIAMLFVALLAGRGLWLLARTRLSFLVLPLALAVPAEHLSPRPVVQHIPVRAALPAVYEWLAHNPARAIVEVPVRGEGLVRMETLEMYFSTAHFKPIIHGYTAYPPLLARALRRAALDFPSELSLQALQRAGVDAVVVHHGRQLEHRLQPQLARAVDGGHLKREARFEGPDARLFDSTVDEVYRIVPAPRWAAAPFPAGHRLRGPQWRYRASSGAAARAGDGDLTTSWTIEDSLRGDEYIRIIFDTPVKVTGVVLPVRRATVLPTRFQLRGRDESLRWSHLATWDDAHALQLLDELLKDPRTAAIGFDLAERSLTGLTLEVAPGGTSFDGWSMPELEVWSR